MNATRTVMWLAGLVVILVGSFMLYFEAGLDRWVSLGIVGAALLVFAGFAFMAFAGGARSDPPARGARDEPTVVVEAPGDVIEVKHSRR